MKVIKETFNFVKHLIENHYLIFELTRRDFQQKYVSNILGLAWSILDPLALMVIFYLIFGLGFRGGKSVDGVPFIVYLVTGLMSYQCFQSALSQATGSIKAYSFLLKKVDFRVSVIPLVKILSEFVVHFIVIVVMIVILLFNGIYPTLYWLQFFYYMFAMGILLLGLSWFTSAVSLFFPDIQNIIGIFLRFFMYLTPIFWHIEMMPVKMQAILKFNPLYYIITGYRNSFIYSRGFWEEPLMALYFWGISVIALAVGITVFVKLKPHFADVA